MTLREVQRSDAFERVRDFDASARFHVWHSRLGISQGADRGAQEALRADRSFAVAGPSGSGKTSILAAAALATDGMERPRLPVPLSVVGGDAERVCDPRQLAYDVVRNIARATSAAESLADDAAPSGRATGEQRRSRGQLGIRGTNVSRELQERSESFDFERTPNEVFDVANEAVRLLRGENVIPVLVLEDADGLLRLPGKSDEERRVLANAFFADGLAGLLDAVELPALVAVQEDYLGLPGFKALEERLDRPAAHCPKPADCDAGGIRLLVEHSLRVSTVDVDDARALFAPEAIELLGANRYSFGEMRTVIEVCNGSVVKATEQGHDVISEGDMAYAITQAAQR